MFACNLKCAGCGKIQHPADVLKQRMPVEQAVAAVECGAPMVSIAGGEPLMHPQIAEMVEELVARRKYVFLCTNALLIPRKIDRFTPSPYFAWAVHIDGLRERHDASVCKEGVFDEAVAAVRECRRRGFRVTTNTTFFAGDSPRTVIEVLDFLNDDLCVDQMMISPGYAYEKAPDQDCFLGVRQTRELFRAAFAGGNRRRWRFNHSPLFLDFLEEGRLPVHGLGDPVLFGVRLAAALLPHGRRVRPDLPGAGRGDRLGRLRPGTRPALRQLHGALRLRADGGLRHPRLAARVPARAARHIGAGRSWMRKTGCRGAIRWNSGSGAVGPSPR